jgi:hypothetical protein
MERLANAKSAQDVLRYLDGIQFPAKKHDIIHAARRNKAPNDIIGALDQLPANEFATSQDLINAYPHLPG